MHVGCHITDQIRIDVGDGTTVTVAASDVIEAIKRPTLTAIELATTVDEMRHAQKEYFRTRSNSALEDSKRLEKKVDKDCQAILDGQKKLFGE